MTTTPFVPEGHVYVDGRSEDRARELLGLAEKAGQRSAVYTTSFGYIVPAAVLADAKDEAENQAVEFDPSAATVEEVQDYLDGADTTERERVLAAEAAGKKRKSLLSATTEGEK